MCLEMLLTIMEMRAISTLIQCNNIRFALAMNQISINAISKYIDSPYNQRHFNGTQFSTGNSSISCHNQKHKFHQIIFKQFPHCLMQNNEIWGRHYISMKVLITIHPITLCTAESNRNVESTVSSPSSKGMFFLQFSAIEKGNKRLPNLPRISILLNFLYRLWSQKIQVFHETCFYYCIHVCISMSVVQQVYI